MPKNSLDQTMLILSKFANREEKVSTGSALASAIKGAEQILKNRSMIFILSDFRCSDYQDNLARLSQKHDVVAIRFTDANDFELPDFGMVRVQDPETNEEKTYPSFSSNFIVTSCCSNVKHFLAFQGIFSRFFCCFFWLAEQFMLLL